jgi:uncharacterized protein YjbI with pentapeptide repeats
VNIQNVHEAVVARDADMTESSFLNTKLAESRFEDVNLRGATFTNASLAGIVCTDVDLSGASISNANVSGMTINGILVDEMMRAYRTRQSHGDRPGDAPTTIE